VLDSWQLVDLYPLVPSTATHIFCQRLGLKDIIKMGLQFRGFLLNFSICGGGSGEPLRTGNKVWLVWR
jgi:hypothetical protein